MTPFTGGDGASRHNVTVTGLDPDPSVLNHVFIRCASNPGFVLSLSYRALAKVNPSYPVPGTSGLR